MKEKATDFYQKLGIFLPFFNFQHTPPDVFMKILTKQPPLFVCRKKIPFFKCLAVGKEATDAVLELGPLRRPGAARPLRSRGLGARGCLSYHKIPTLLSGSSSKATRSLRPTGVPRLPGRIAARVPGEPSRHRQLPSSSPQRAARPRQRCQPAPTSSINSLHTVHIDRFCSLPSSPRSLARPPPRRLLHRWAARPAGSIQTHLLREINGLERAHAARRGVCLGIDRATRRHREQQPAPCLPGAPRGSQGTR